MVVICRLLVILVANLLNCMKQMSNIKIITLKNILIIINGYIRQFEIDMYI